LPVVGPADPSDDEYRKPRLSAQQQLFTSAAWLSNERLSKSFVKGTLGFLFSTSGGAG
jgi:hypothetical protein